MSTRRACKHAVAAGALALGLAAPPPVQAAADAHAPGFGAALPLWSTLPFVGILLSIALFPLLRPHFWHRHYPKITLFWALSLAVPFLIAHRSAALDAILHTYILEYVPFIVLLWALFTVAGGIVVRGSLAATPGANVLLLLAATLIASWVGTTGASMLLIHPLLRANQRRRYRVHTVVFFIFLASNIGGALTPLGDPPLFLGFLSGVPFFWTLHLIPHAAVLAGTLLLAYYIVERRAYAKDAAEHEGGAAAFARGGDPFRLAGRRNLPLLLGIVGVVLFSGTVHWRSVNVLGVDVPLQNLLRDGLLLAIGLASLRLTPPAFRAENQFSWAPIREVAYLFAGIFMTIIPALAILQAGEAGALAFLVRAVETPADYYWATGSLSSFLDNAPTYLTFLNTALGKYFTGMETHAAVALLIAEQVRILAAISAGAVFFGAMTYIGNAPNFMVRAIAEERGVRMPSFFGFILRWSLPILLPALLLVALLFFR